MTQCVTVADLQQRIEQFSEDLKAKVYVPLGNGEYLRLNIDFLTLCKSHLHSDDGLSLAITTESIERIKPSLSAGLSPPQVSDINTFAIEK